MFSKSKTLNNIFDKLKPGCYFCPLGGTNEIGMNFNLYTMIYENGDRDSIIIDMGVSFLRDYGLTLKMSDMSQIVDENILGIIVTHAHEDHLGAIPYLYKRFNKIIPIYMGKFTASILKNKMHNISYKECITKENQPFNIGNFHIELLYITHSVPEPHMIFIDFKPFNFKAIHTGDWKLDKNPIVGNPTDENQLKSIGDIGIDVMLCDSTNALEKNASGDEGDAKNNLLKLIKTYDNTKRIIVSCFASNVARVKSLCDIASITGRKVYTMGISIERMTQAAKYNELIDFSEYEKNKLFINDKQKMLKIKDKVLIICTGSQGEPNAALSRMANNKDPVIKLNSEDVVIFSSRVIPGNEIVISNLKNNLIRRYGLEIVDSKYYNIHVSGHPSEPEVCRMLELIRPKTLIPVHGNPKLFQALAKIGESQNIPSVIPEDGVIINLLEKKIERKIPADILVLDGKQLYRSDDKFINERKHISSEGVIVIYNKKIKCLGIDLTKDQYKSLYSNLSKYIKDNLTNNKEDLILLKQDFKKYIQKEKGKNPYIVILV